MTLFERVLSKQLYAEISFSVGILERLANVIFAWEEQTEELLRHNDSSEISYFEASLRSTLFGG